MAKEKRGESGREEEHSRIIDRYWLFVSAFLGPRPPPFAQCTHTHWRPCKTVVTLFDAESNVNTLATQQKKKLNVKLLPVESVNGIQYVSADWLYQRKSSILIMTKSWIFPMQKFLLSLPHAVVIYSIDFHVCVCVCVFKLVGVLLCTSSFCLLKLCSFLVLKWWYIGIS